MINYTNVTKHRVKIQYNIKNETGESISVFFRLGLDYFVNVCYYNYNMTQRDR